jgi:NodT family efflux transporter outer membrane factor (OMF) lipoprotein
VRRLFLLLPALVAGCAVGPDFERPAPPPDSAYARPQGGEGQSYAADLDIPADWWGLFQSPALTRLVQQALAANPTVEAAQAALRQAHELALAQSAAFFPLLSGNLDVARAKNANLSIANPTNSPTAYYNLYTAQLALSYVPDIWGANRRAVEAAEAQEGIDRFQLEATDLTLASNVVVTAIAEASLRGQIAATERLLAIARQLTDIARRQRGIGTASELDLLAAEAAEAQIAETLPPLEKQLGQARDALAALLGRPAAPEPEEIFHLEDFILPRRLPLSLPSRLVEQRPDVRAAEEAMHMASAQVGVALSDMLPQFAVSGGIGSSALRADQLFNPGNGFWSVGGSLTQTLFDAGALLHRRRAADAALDQAAALYRATVLAAIQNVADSLFALAADDKALKAAEQGAGAAKSAWQLAKAQRRIGGISLTAELAAEQAYLQAEITLLAARAAQLADSAGLIQALGGGWWNRAKQE